MEEKLTGGTFFIKKKKKFAAYALSNLQLCIKKIASATITGAAALPLKKMTALSTHTHTVCRRARVSLRCWRGSEAPEMFPAESLARNSCAFLSKCP